MSDILQNPSFLIWTKGPAALEAMRNSLCGHIRRVWIDHLETFTAEEIDHLEQFIKDMNAGFAVVKTNKKTEEKEWLLQCKHHLCERLLNKLIHIRTNPKSKKIVWKTNCKTNEPLPLKIGLAEIFDNHRDICKTYYWHIANMFMCYGSEDYETYSRGPYDTDVSLVLKMLKNCTLFEIDEKQLYGTVIGIRNRLFHTAHYNMTKEGMHLMIDDMSNLLKQVQVMPQCWSKHKTQIANGIAKLEEIDKRDVVTISLKRDIEWESMAVQALQLQRHAIIFDISFKATFMFDTTSLEKILKDVDDRIQMYTDTDTWRENKEREEEEKKRKEWGKIIEPLEKKIKTLEEELEKAQNVGNYTCFWCTHFRGHHYFWPQFHTGNDRLSSENNERHWQEERARLVRDVERREQEERVRRLREEIEHVERRQQAERENLRRGNYEGNRQFHTGNDRLSSENNERHRQEERARRVREDVEKREQEERDRRLREEIERRQQAERENLRSGNYKGNRQHNEEFS